jgi:hypothetical protein
LEVGRVANNPPSERGYNATEARALVDIHFTHESLVLEVKGSHKFWALKSVLDIPLEHIKSVHADPKPAMGWFQGLKIAGTDLPNFFRAGLFYQEGEKVFWDVRHPKNTIVIEMRDEGFTKLIVEVKDPEAAVQEIRAAIVDYQIAKDAAAKELEQYLQGTGAKSESAADVELEVRENP